MFIGKVKEIREGMKEAQNRKKKFMLIIGEDH